MAHKSTENACVFGLGWGDEGKGKIVDLLCPSYDFVVRFNGGANAGHTVCIGQDTFTLHLLPAGVLHEGKTAVIGPGVVVDPIQVLAEVDELAGRGIDVAGRLAISDRAHLVLAHHKVEDQLGERAAGANTRIGTTARGIGPCYADKMKRSSAIRFADLLHEKTLEDRLRGIVTTRRKMFQALYGQDGGLDAEAVIADLRRAHERLGPLVTDTTSLLREAFGQGRPVLFEGANGMLLDVDHGTYPFVTSSSTGPQGICAGAGVPPGKVDTLIGVTKAYATRVGAGPFVSELEDETGQRIREAGNEYGTTTRRPRRCGWLDVVTVKYSVGLSGCTELALMHLDTLRGFERIGLCVAYECDGRRVTTLPADPGQLARAKPIIEFVPGWSEDLGEMRSFADLPETTRRYVEHIEALAGVPVTIVSVGPERTQTLLRGRLQGITSA